MAKHKPDQPGSVPRVAIVAAIVALVAIVGAVIVALSLGKGLDSKATPLVVSLLGIVATTITSLIAVAFSARASQDIRNGVVQEKARQGATQAIQEQQVMTRIGPAVTAELAALTELVLTNREIAGHLEAANLQSFPRVTNPSAARSPHSGP